MRARRGKDIDRLMGEAAQHVREIHALVTEELAARVLPRLGLPQAAGVPIVIRTIQGHMNARGARLG